MNVARITVTLFLLINVYSTVSCTKNDEDGPISNSGSHSIRRSRRIALNEYLVPPPPPKPHSLRAGRVVTNPTPVEPSGYFSQFMTWLNPFNYGPTPTTPQKSPPYHETPHPPPPQSYGPPQFNLHPSLQSGSPHHQHPASPQQVAVPFYPPLGPPPAQHPNPIHVVPPGVNPPLNLPPGPALNLSPGPALNLPPGPALNLPPGPALNLPPGPALNPALPSPSLHLYNAPSATLSNLYHGVPPSKSNHGSHVALNKGKACNPCNKVPWTPMQTGGHHSDNYPPPQPFSNAYLPPSGQTNHDVQYAASHEIKIPDFSQIPLEENAQHPSSSSFPNPMLYPGPVPPLYKAKPFDRSPQNPPRTETVIHYEPPPLQSVSSGGQNQNNHETNNEGYNVYGNGDLTSSGVQVNQEHASVIHQTHGIENNKELTDHKESLGTSVFDTHPPISGPSFDQEYRNGPPNPVQEPDGILTLPVQQSQDSITSLGSSSVDNQNFPSQNGDEYQDSSKSIAGENNGVNYLPPDLNPSASYGTSSYNNQDIDSFNHRYSDDLSPSGSVVKDSHVQTTQSSLASGSSLNQGHIHFEESPLLDLTNKSESGTDLQWTTSTNGYTDVDETSDNTATTTPNYNRGSDNIYFEDSSSFVRPTESYTSSEIQNINSVFGPSTSTSVEFSATEKYQHGETSTTGPRYTNQQDVSYIPPSGQPGFLWPSLLLKAPDFRSGSTPNQPFLNHFARWNNSSQEVKTIGQQNRVDSKDGIAILQRQQNPKRNKQVQVIIPYTSDYTPIPFQQSHGDWSTKTNFERAQARKIPSRSELNTDNYLQQESKNDIRVINQLQTQFEVNNSNNKLNGPSIRPLATIENLKSPTTKVNSSIDVRRLQKNIDNWTIQEYSKPTTSSTILPSSLHPYLLPSKKIPTEYLTTTESADRKNESLDHNESVKTYSLAGFSFNEVEHEGSASNRIEDTRVPANVERIDSSKATDNGLQSINKFATDGKSTWDGYSVSISPVNKERVYVVTPQPKPEVPPKNDLEKKKSDGKKDLQRKNETIIDDTSNGKNNLSEFEAIEKAYQVLPQAVNNLAVASTGKENIPLWGIMEHEEFASLNLNENDEEVADDVPDGPVLYTGHSKVSRAKR